MGDALLASPLLAGVAFFTLLSLVLNAILFVRLHRLVKGGDGKTLEGTITKLGERVSMLEAHAQKAEAAFENVDARLAGSVRGVAVKRFDPFQNAGGQQSFAAAFLSEEGDGVVLSGIHARDGVRVYAKGLKAFTPAQELSVEEQGAIDEAKSKLAK